MLTSALAIYAAVLSTISLIHTIKSTRSNRPIVDVSWEYNQEDRCFEVLLNNLGGSDVSIRQIAFVLERHEVTHRSRISDGFAMKVHQLDSFDIAELSTLKPKPSLPIRLQGHSTTTMAFDAACIAEIVGKRALTELFIAIIAVLPTGNSRCYIPNSILRELLDAPDS